MIGKTWSETQKVIPTIYIEKEPCISHSLSLSPPKVKVKVKSLTYGHKLIKELSTERTILSPFTKKKKEKKKRLASCSFGQIG